MQGKGDHPGVTGRGVALDGASWSTKVSIAVQKFGITDCKGGETT